MILLDFATPEWFALPQIIIYFVFGLITFLIARQSFKVYRLSGQRRTGLFSLAFAFLSTGYIVQAILQWIVYQHLQAINLLKTPLEIISQMVTHTISISYIATVLHMSILLFAWVILSYVTLKEKGKKIFLLIFAITFLAMLFSAYPGATFFTLTAVFLLFITAQYTQTYFRKRQRTTLYIAIGFALLFIGENLLALTYAVESVCVIGQIFLLGGFIFLLASLCKVRRKPKVTERKNSKKIINKKKANKTTKKKTNTRKKENTKKNKRTKNNN